MGAYHQRSDNLPKNAVTPNIDQLAREGMLFTQSFTATAMCTVTRSQLYTGLYPVRNGAYGNHTCVYEDVKSVVHYFRDVGYRVGLAGKGHIFPSKSFPFVNVTPGSVSNALIEYVDVVPTLIDIVSNNVPENMDGQSFKSVLMGQKTEHKDYVFGIQTSFNIHDGAAYPIRSVRSKSLKLIHNLMSGGEFSSILTNGPWFKEELQNAESPNGTLYARYLKRPEYELYDIVKDPFEQKNIIDMPGYEDEVAILRSRLSSWMVQQGDQGVETELSVCERKGFSHRRCL